MDFRKFFEAEEGRQRQFSWMGVTEISPKEKHDRKLIGPVYHGSTEDGHMSINDQGFKIFTGPARKGDVANGFTLAGWGNSNIPPPVHFFGFGVYFTFSYGRAKTFNQGSIRGLRAYYLDAPRVETINFRAKQKMMQWWVANGYKMQPIASFANEEEAEQARVKATIRMTNVLKSKFDACYIKGTGFGGSLDGNQICVYDPNRIYTINYAMAKPMEVGSTVTIKPGSGAGSKIYDKNEMETFVGIPLRVIEYRRIPQEIADEYWGGETILASCVPLKGSGNITAARSWLEPYHGK
jgi:hypothetical protein